MESDEIKRKARELGFELAGVAPLGPSPEAAFYPEWLSRGFAGEMHYLERGAGRGQTRPRFCRAPDRSSFAL